VSWLNLVTPSAAIIAIFLAVALVIQSVRHGRQIRRIEQQIKAAGIAAYDPTLERLKELSGLSETAPGERRPTRTRNRGPLLIAGVVAGVIVLIGIVWALVGGSGSSSSTASTGSKRTTSAAHTATTATQTATAAASVCANAAPVASPSAITVSVLNGSGVTGAARNVVGPKVTGIGYTLGTIGDTPTATVLSTSSVQYVTKADIPAACSIATALGVPVTRVTSLTVIPAANAGTAGVVVVVGKDIAK
jgi:hypothetical protein